MRQRLQDTSPNIGRGSVNRDEILTLREFGRRLNLASRAGPCAAARTSDNSFRPGEIRSRPRPALTGSIGWPSSSKEGGPVNNAPAEAHPKQQADLAEIRRALELLAVPGGVVEIRALKIPGRGKPHSAAGYFTDLDAAAQAAAALDARKAAGVYVVLNEIDRALLARSPNQITDHLEPTTSDTEIIRRRWFPLDFDPTRRSGISASDDEHCAAEDAARRCAAWLSSLGWPAPILADNGNGAICCIVWTYPPMMAVLCSAVWRPSREMRHGRREG